MKTKIKISLLEKACSKIEAIAARISTSQAQQAANLPSRVNIKSEVKEVIADLEMAIVEIKNIQKQQQLETKENRAIERLKPVQI
ncbi:MAG: hypothetical protein QNJ38_02830 [Prochloraceae cyanobacterium]|nr:hypothetical protein [Prochloraceae cyanobacterium]